MPNEEKNPTFKIATSNKISIINNDNNEADLEIVNTNSGNSSEGSHDSNIIFSKQTNTSVMGNSVSTNSPLGKISVSYANSAVQGDNKGKMIFSVNSGNSEDHTNITEVLKLGPTETVYNNTLPDQSSVPDLNKVKLNSVALPSENINTLTADNAYNNNILEIINLEGSNLNLGGSNLNVKRKIISYDGNAQVVTLESNLPTNATQNLQAKIHSATMTVNGDIVSTNLIATNNKTMTDTLLKLGEGLTENPSKDQGIVFTRGDGTDTNKTNKAIIWDESTDSFAFIQTDDDGTTAGDVTITNYEKINVTEVDNPTGDLKLSKAGANKLVVNDNGISVTGTGIFTGTITAATASSIGNLTLGDASITDSSGSISFGDENLSTTGTLNSGNTTSGTLTVGSNQNGSQVKFFGDADGAYLLWDDTVDDLKLIGGAGIVQTGIGSNSLGATTFNAPALFNTSLTVGADDTGYDVKFFGATSGAFMLWDESVDQLKLEGGAGIVQTGIGSRPLGATTFNAPALFNTSLTVGADDTGYDVKFFGATSGAFMLWDESVDQLQPLLNLKVVILVLFKQECCGMNPVET